MPKRKIENRTIEVILLKQDKYLGEKFEIVKVKPIYAKNILLPNKIAVLADASNKNTYEQKIIAAEKERENKAKGFEDLFVKIENDGGLTLTRKANEDDVLYAKVSENDLSKEIKDKYSFDVEPHYFKLKKIGKTGNYQISFIFKDLKRDINLTILPEETKKTKKSEDSKQEKVNEENKEDQENEKKE